MRTPFDEFYDFNGDGQLDGLEQAARDGLLNRVYGELYRSELAAEAGLDADEWDSMDGDERDGLQDEVSLDPDDTWL